MLRSMWSFSIPVRGSYMAIYNGRHFTLPNLSIAVASKRQCFHTSSPSGGSPTRFRGPRRRGSQHVREAGRTLIDKFVKHLAHDGAIVIRAPFLTEIRGSHFDENNKVDKVMNNTMTEIYRRQHDENGPITMSSPVVKEIVSSVKEKPATKAEKDEHLVKTDKLQASKEEELLEAKRKELKKVTQILQDQIEREERRNREEDSGWIHTDSAESELSPTSPLHILLYGRSNHQSGSYSVVNDRLQQHTYVYLTDSESDTPLLERDAIKDQYHRTSVKEESYVHTSQGYSATAHMSLWEPRQSSALTHGNAGSLPGSRGEVFSSSLRFYSFKNILESYEASIKALCLLPMNMNKIYYQGDLAGQVLLDGTLIEGLQSIGLNTEMGPIRLRDVTSDDISVSSRYGDIRLDGLIDGAVNIETGGEGEIFANCKGIYGESFIATADNGDIHMDTECRSDELYLATNDGNITAKELLCSSVSLHVNEKGDINAKVNGGKLEVSVNKGSVNLSLDNLALESSIAVHSGDVNLRIPLKTPFKLRLSAPMTNVEPKLQNSGEFCLSKDSGNEVFSTEGASRNGHAPILSVVVQNGSINVAVREDDVDKSLGYDSVTENLIK